MATATKSTNVFAGLRCPHCGESESLNVKVEDLTLVCTSCEDEITHAEVKEVVDKWIRLFNWLDMAK